MSGRLHALAATDEFVRNSATESASLHDILAIESAPYATVRFHIAGPEVRVARKLAITLALMLHELATNATKYGALSAAEGYVTVSWTINSQRVKLEWIEQNGPKVSAPAHRGFGLALIQTSLAAYDGAAELSFRSEGVVCQLSFSTSGDEALGRFGAPSRRRDSDTS